jgi:hypothetical protein
MLEDLDTLTIEEIQQWLDKRLDGIEGVPALQEAGVIPKAEDIFLEARKMIKFLKRKAEFGDA